MPEPLSPPADAVPLAPVRVWDLPTRVFHWLLALCIVGSVVSAQIGGNAMSLHFSLGYGVLALLVFRLVWGVVGGRWSRFSSFVYAPRTVMRYLRGEVRPGEQFDVGHNPLGSLSVFALLGVLVLQVASGLFADDEIANIGPLNRFVSGATAALATSWHEKFGQYLIYGLVAMHIGAIVFYRVRKQQDLIGPMLRGDKRLPANTPASTDSLTTRLLALVLALACMGLGWWVSLQGG